MIWKDRIKQYPHRYTLTQVSGSTYDFTEVTGEVTEAGTPVNAENLNAMGKEINSRVIKELSINLHAKKPLGGNWTTKTWTGLTDCNGGLIWTDGTNIYCSNRASQYVLDVATSTWSVKNWTGLTSFFGDNIWTDGTNIYYSFGNEQYVLDTATSTWSVKTWTGLTSYYGYYIWTDGTNIYYSNGATQRVLDVATSTWSVKTWTGLTEYLGDYIWTDGTNIYYSEGASQYVLIPKKSIRGNFQ